MFSILATFALLASSAFAAPVKVARDDHFSPNHPTSRLTRHVRFNNWGGFKSLHNFDDFYGWENFDGHRNRKFIVKEKQLVCRKVEVEHVQQQLVIIQEYVKRLIVEQVCEVEVQTILLSQWSKHWDGWHRDIRRKSKKLVTFDHEIAGHFPKLVDEHGAIRSHNWGFKGFDVGRRSVHVIGDNWDHKISPHRVDKAFWDSWGYRDYFGFEFPDQGFDFKWFKTHPIDFRYFYGHDFDFEFKGKSPFDFGSRFPGFGFDDETHSPEFSYFPGSKGDFTGDDLEDDFDANPTPLPPADTGAIPTATGTESSAAPTPTDAADATGDAGAADGADAGADDAGAAAPPVAA